jgi:hypothetical protein
MSTTATGGGRLRQRGFGGGGGAGGNVLFDAALEVHPWLSKTMG